MIFIEFINYLTLYALWTITSLHSALWHQETSSIRPYNSNHTCRPQGLHYRKLYYLFSSKNVPHPTPFSKDFQLSPI